MNDIYNHKEGLKKYLQNYLTNPQIHPEDKNKTTPFLEEASLHIGTARKKRFLIALKQMQEWFNPKYKKPLSQASKEELKSLIARINTASLFNDKKEYSEWTKFSFKICLRKFINHTEGKDWNNHQYSDRTAWIPLKIQKNTEKKPEDMITENELIAMLKKASTIRDKTLISLLFECGLRIGEAATIQRQDLTKDEYGFKIKVNGKTGYRQVRAITSVPHITQLLDTIPTTPETFLFHSFKPNQPMEYAALRKIIKVTARKAGIKKRIHLHLFRHTALTRMASKLPDSILKNYAGWTNDSKQAGTYIHLSGETVDNKILEMNGLKKTENTNGKELKAKTCPVCKNSNGAENDYCTHCYHALNSIEETLTEEHLTNSFFQDLDTALREPSFEKFRETLKLTLTEIRKQKGTVIK